MSTLAVLLVRSQITRDNESDEQQTSHETICNEEMRRVVPEISEKKRNTGVANDRRHYRRNGKIRGPNAVNRVERLSQLEKSARCDSRNRQQKGETRCRLTIHPGQKSARDRRSRAG